jgi:hypothetical protein
MTKIVVNAQSFRKMKCSHFNDKLYMKFKNPN